MRLKSTECYNELFFQLRPTMIRLGLILGLLSIPMSAEAGTTCTERSEWMGGGYSCDSDAGSYTVTPRSEWMGGGYTIDGPNYKRTTCTSRSEWMGGGFTCN